MDPRLESQLDLSGLRYTEDDDGDARVVFRYDDGRTQQVIIDSATDSFGPHEDRDVWSGVIAFEDTLAPGLAQALLEENGTFKVGAFAIRGSAVVFKADVPAQCTPDLLKYIVEAVAEVADTWERKLAQGSDQF